MESALVLSAQSQIEKTMATFVAQCRMTQWVLMVAVILLVASQLFPCSIADERTGWYFLALKEDAQDALGLARAPSPPSSRVAICFPATPRLPNATEITEWIASFLHLVVLVISPWLVGLLSKARPWLWILRCLMIAMLGLTAWAAKTVPQAVSWREEMLMNFKGATPLELTELSMKFPLYAGYWLFLAAAVVNLVGLFMIPRAGVRGTASS
jgi:hypothetical protein